jgi:nicotinamidase-related amidase
MKTALLIIDVQNDYFPDGKMELNNSIAAVNKIKDMLHVFRNRYMPVVHIQHISLKPGASFFLPGTTGAEFHDHVKPLSGEKVFVKNYPNSFRDTGLDEFLKKNDISRLVIAGMMTHMCIDTSVRAAFDLGYECIVAGDCCATRTLNIDNIAVSAENVQYAFLASLNGTFTKVLNKDDVLNIIK